MLRSKIIEKKDFSMYVSMYALLWFSKFDKVSIMET